MALTAENVAQLFQYALVVWFALLAGYVLYAILLRGRAFEEMLRGDGRSIDPERVSAFFITLLVAGWYVLTTLNSDPERAADGNYWMPDIHESLLFILAGGKSLFIAGKITRRLR